MSRLREVLRRRYRVKYMDGGGRGRGVDAAPASKVGETPSQTVDAVLKDSIQACGMSRFDEIRVTERVKELTEGVPKAEVCEWLLSEEALTRLKGVSGEESGAGSGDTELLRRSLSAPPTKMLRRALGRAGGPGLLPEGGRLPSIFEVDENSPSYAPSKDRFATESKSGLIDGGERTRKQERLKARLQRIRERQDAILGKCKEQDDKIRRRGRAAMERKKQATSAYMIGVRRMQKMEDRHLHSVRGSGMHNPSGTCSAEKPGLIMSLGGLQGSEERTLKATGRRIVQRATRPTALL
tara:strand:+ start:134 stop:1021 length:888 start_codon:yes stop_codon:yes gene_type:complete